MKAPAARSPRAGMTVTRCVRSMAGASAPAGVKIASNTGAGDMAYARRRLSFTASLIFVALVKASSATAASGYKCIVNNVYALSRDAIRPHVFSERYHKQEFIVDRITGRMLGFFWSGTW